MTWVDEKWREFKWEWFNVIGVEEGWRKLTRFDEGTRIIAELYEKKLDEKSTEVLNPHD